MITKQTEKALKNAHLKKVCTDSIDNIKRVYDYVTEKPEALK